MLFVVHRVGRTGRAGRTGNFDSIVKIIGIWNPILINCSSISGVAVSFVTRSDWASAEELIKILEEADQLIPDELREMKTRFDAMKERRDKERQSFGGSGGGSRRYLTITILLFKC